MEGADFPEKLHFATALDNQTFRTQNLAIPGEKLSHMRSAVAFALIAASWMR